MLSNISEVFGCDHWEFQILLESYVILINLSLNNPLLMATVLDIASTEYLFPVVKAMNALWKIPLAYMMIMNYTKLQFQLRISRSYKGF